MQLPQASRSSNAPGVLTTANVQGGATGKSNILSTNTAIPEILTQGRKTYEIFLFRGEVKKFMCFVCIDPTAKLGGTHELLLVNFSWNLGDVLGCKEKVLY